MAYADDDVREEVACIFLEAARAAPRRTSYALRREEDVATDNVTARMLRARIEEAFVVWNRTKPITNIGACETTCPKCGQTGSLRVGAARVFHAGNTSCVL